MEDQLALLRMIAFLAANSEEAGYSEAAMYLRIAHCALWDEIKRQRSVKR